MAYGATEPEAGSDLGALKTVAVPVTEDGVVVSYRITGRKQWISNGGVADLYSILANTPGGPTWFVLDRGTDGFTNGKPENKHGIRLSNTAALFLDDVAVDADRLVGGVEGQGLVQAQQVFGYTRLMVAAFGLGAGWAALDRAIPYSAERIQAGGPLSEKQGYTYKLIVPHAIRLEAARAYIEETAEHIDRDEGLFNTEGAIAKYMATEAGNGAADAAIQALGGYGYTHEYMVEKIKRDVRITTIYEGTSEIMEMTIGRDRWQQHLKTSGRHYHDQAEALEALHRTDPLVGADVAALAHHALAEIMEACRVARLTRNQHVLLRLGEWAAWTESAAALARRAARAGAGRVPEKGDPRFDAAALAADEPRVRPRGGHEGGHRGHPVGARRECRGRCRPRRTGRTGGRARGPTRPRRRHGRGGRRAIREDHMSERNEPTVPIAIVGLGAILPDAPDVATFWHNLEQGRYSISDVRAERWDPELYYDEDPKAPERTYSKIGGWVREWTWAPHEWHLPIPPKVGDVMDDAQKWAVACTHAALTDYGWPDRTLDNERTAVILGNAMAGEKHYQTALRIAFPEFARELAAAPSFAALPPDQRGEIIAEFHRRMDGLTPAITEDTMPGELGNCHRRPRRQPLRPARPELRRRRRVRVSDGRVRRVDRRARRG